MCGIAGFVGPRDGARLEKMLNCIVHRGPDDSGSIETDWCSLGMRRLAIVDFAGGRQPFTSSDGRIALGFKWRNLQPPRVASQLSSGKELSLPRTIRTRRSYCDYTSGADWISWVTSSGCLRSRSSIFGAVPHLIRDRMGERPIDYWVNAEAAELEFASEFNALRVDGERGSVGRGVAAMVFRDEGDAGRRDDRLGDPAVPAGCRFSLRRGQVRGRTLPPNGEETDAGKVSPRRGLWKNWRRG